jgi:hypothetical protein
VTLQTIAYALGLVTPVFGAAKFYWDMQRTRKELDGVAHRARENARREDRRFRAVCALLAESSEGHLRARAIALLASE